jgi:hypothetical protein
MDIYPLEAIDMEQVYALTKSAVSRSKQWVYREFDDTLQEALLYVTSNLKYYNKKKGGLPTFIFANVKRSLMNQVKYVNAKKRQIYNNMYSLDMQLNEDNTLADHIPDVSTIEHEAIWEDLLQRLSPMERDIAIALATGDQFKPIEKRYNRSWETNAKT